ncbi:hypothetical protein TR51_18165 [Kitasatospora griseola]|uniref:Uncharacterized protein n=1 Tax=Kitasatospora griseola TaxID=2064 RepID=A0A0D0NBY0_KITGR|nr:hypothetical protein TR51_18165 [Kitasatospora griseola]
MPEARMSATKPTAWPVGISRAYRRAASGIGSSAQAVRASSAVANQLSSSGSWSIRQAEAVVSRSVGGRFPPVTRSGTATNQPARRVSVGDGRDW